MGINERYEKNAREKNEKAENKMVIKKYKQKW